MKQALLDCFALKEVLREGWVRAGVASPESVAAHSWGVALLVVMTLPDDLNREKALVYAILHDLAEAWVGDITPADGIPREEKHARELDAMTALTQRLGRPDLLDLWKDYERQADDESRFVKQLDRLDMGLQAARYASTQALDLREFTNSAQQGIDHPVLDHLLRSSE